MKDLQVFINNILDIFITKKSLPKDVLNDFIAYFYFTLDKEIKSNKYRYSKYLVMKLFQIINSISGEMRDSVVQDFYLYASSQATYSAPYYKLE